MLCILPYGFQTSLLEPSLNFPSMAMASFKTAVTSAGSASQYYVANPFPTKSIRRKRRTSSTEASATLEERRLAEGSRLSMQGSGKIRETTNSRQRRIREVVVELHPRSLRLRREAEASRLAKRDEFLSEDCPLIKNPNIRSKSLKEVKAVSNTQNMVSDKCY